MIDAFRTIVRNDGLKGLTRGMQGMIIELLSLSLFPLALMQAQALHCV